MKKSNAKPEVEADKIIQSKSLANREKSKFGKWLKFALYIVCGLLFLSAVSAIGTQTSTSPSGQSKTQTDAGISQSIPEDSSEKKPDVPTEYKSALRQAETYSSTLHLSKQGVYDQLVSEYGGKFEADAAKYAIDNVNADWNANALAQAKSYQNTMHLSKAAIRDQLVSEYGGKFTASEADYALLHLND